VARRIGSATRGTRIDNCIPEEKEWAYAGTVFDLTGAAASHLAVGDDAMKVATPLVFTALAFASWALRPPARRN
jgi:hypothetical protein